METTNGNDPTKLIVDVSSGTIVLLEQCRIVQADQLPMDYELSDGEMGALAKRVGTPIPTLDNYTEEQALKLMWSLVRRFGWRGTMFTQTDIRDAIEEMVGLNVATDEQATDEQIQAVMKTRMWVKTLEDALVREGMECLYDAIREVSDNE
jgi:hypothetical protein